MDGRRGARKPRKTTQRESVLQAHVMRWLMVQPDVLAWVVKSVGTYDPKIRKFRKPPKWYRLGVPDVHIIVNRLYIVIELKSEDGELRPSQVQFKEAFLNARARNMHHATARSLDRVIEIVEAARKLVVPAEYVPLN